MMDTIGQQIKKYRIERGYTQEKLGGLIGVTTQAVSKWERGSSMPDAELIPHIAQSLGVSIDALYGSEEQNLSVQLAQKLCHMSKNEAYRRAFELCWTIQVGLLGEPSAVELFVNRGFTESDKANDHFAKLIHDSGITLSRLSPQPQYFFLLKEPEEGGILSQLESLDSLQKVFALFADKNVLKIICYLYSLPVMPVAASLISKRTHLPENKVEEYMKKICARHLATCAEIATADGKMNAYTVRPEAFAVPLICFADEIAKDDVQPFFGTHERKKPFF